MADQIVIAGLGDFGSLVARALAKAGYDVLAVDRRPEPVRELSDTLSKVVQGDAASASLWADLPITKATIGIVAFSSGIESNVLAALLLRKLGLRQVIAKSANELHTELLHAIGVDAVIEPGKESALRLVHTLGSRIEDYIQLSEDFGVAKITATALLDGSLIGNLFEDRKVTVLALLRQDRITLQPRDDEEVKEGDTLLIAGKDQHLRQLAGGDGEK